MTLETVRADLADLADRLDTVIGDVDELLAEATEPEPPEDEPQGPPDEPDGPPEPAPDPQPEPPDLPQLPDEFIAVPSGYKNLAKALGKAKPGDTFLLEPHTGGNPHRVIFNHEGIGGTFARPSGLRVQGTAQEPITITSAPGTKWTGILGFGQQDRHIRLEGLNHAGNSGARTMYAVQLRGTQHVDIAFCRFDEYLHWKLYSDTVAIWMGGGAQHVHIYNCDFSNIGADCIHTYNSRDVVVENCIAAWDGELRTIEGHRVPIGENFIDIKGADNWTVRNNLVTGPTRYAAYRYSQNQTEPGKKAELGSTSQGGEGVVVHKWGGRNLEFIDNDFRGMHYGYRILGNSTLNAVAKNDPEDHSDNITIRGGYVDAAGQPPGAQATAAAIFVGTGVVFPGINTPVYPRVTVDAVDIRGQWAGGDIVAKGTGNRHPQVTLRNMPNGLDLRRQAGGVIS